MLSKRQFIINGNPKQLLTFTILYFLLPNRNSSFLISCDQKMTLIRIHFHCIFIKPLKSFIGLKSKQFNNHINIFETDIRCCVISIICYDNWFDNKKEVIMRMLKRKRLSIEPWGTPKSVSCHVLYSLYLSLLVVSSLRDNYKLVLVNLSQSHKHAI